MMHFFRRRLGRLDAKSPQREFAGGDCAHRFVVRGVRVMLYMEYHL